MNAVFQAQPLKVCNCCKRTFTQAEWTTLAFVAHQTYPWREVQELRNCPCSSTLAIVLVEGDPED